MKKHVKNLKRKLLLSSVVFFLFVFAGSMAFIFYVYSFNYTKTIGDFQFLTGNAFKYVMQDTVDDYKDVEKRLAASPDVKSFVKLKNRKGLYKFLKPEWIRLKKKNPYLKAFLVVMPNGKVLVRMHNPAVFGDNIARIRPIIKAENSLRKTLAGYETGKFTTAYRIIMPVFDNKTYIGLIDIGINPLFIVKQVKDITGYQGYLFIKKSSLKLFNRNADIVVGDYVLQKDKNKKYIDLIKNIGTKNILSNRYTFTFKEREYLTHVLNIKDYKGSVNVKLVFLQDVTDIYNSKMYFIYTIMGLSIFGLTVVLLFVNRQIKTLETGISKINGAHIKDIENEKKELKDFKRMFNLFADHSPLLIYMKDENFRYIYTNSIFKKWIGRNDVLNKKFEEIVDKERADRIDELDKRVLKEKSVQAVAKLKNSKGEEKILRIHKFLINYQGRRYIGNVSADITESYLINEKMIEREKILREAQKIADLGYFLYKAKEKRLELSDELLSIFGFEKEEFNYSREKFLKYLHKDDVEKVNKAFYYTLSGKGESTVRYRFLRKNDASLRYMEARYETVRNESGEVVEVMGVTQDVTDRVELQNKLREKEELMIAQSRHAAMGEMISMIAHQWRQPLSIISMAVNNIMIDIELGEIDEDELKRIANEIIKQTQHLSKTIDDFRNFFKPAKDRDVVCINNVVEESAKFVEKSLENNSIKLNKSYTADSKINTYSRQLLQVLITIMQNAKEALIERHISNRGIDIKTYENDKNVYIKICDNAGGIDNEIADRVFEPYFSTKEEKSGTGLGLYMAKIIMEKHIKGRLWFENISDGVCFFIEIPKES